MVGERGREGRWEEDTENTKLTSIIKSDTRDLKLLSRLFKNCM